MSEKISFEECTLTIELGDKLRVFVDSPLVTDGMTMVLTKEEAITLASLLENWVLHGSLEPLEDN